MKKKVISIMAGLSLIAASDAQNFKYNVDSFADVDVLRYEVPGFDKLTLQQKEYIYYLSMAALEGRDIIFDQNNRFNLPIRRTLELVYTHYKGNKKDPNFLALEEYLKRIWFSNGIHHHYSEDKFMPEFTRDFFETEVRKLNAKQLPLKSGQTVFEFLKMLASPMFDPEYLAKKVNQSADDMIFASANNYYEEAITQKRAQEFYAEMRDPNDKQPISYGLNSRLGRKGSKIVEKIWKIGGLYTEAIEKIVFWLSQAKRVAENDKQKEILDKLISYYTTGDLREFDQYSVAWVQDTDSHVDFINGFIETYGDALGIKASWESVVNFKNVEATKRAQIISDNAQWFEDNSPVDPRFKKEQVKGVSAKVVTVAQIAGDCYPATPIGINLPNADWIRRDHGSKSVTIENIMEAYDKAGQNSGMAEEFMYSDREVGLAKKYGFITDVLHTDLHECLGHGSGKLLPETDPNALGEFSSVIEETRADLYGLYFMGDSKMVALGLLPDIEAYKAEYYKFMLNGLVTQLVRIQAGKDIEEAHMRNRQLIAKWVMEKGKAEKVVEFMLRDGKSYVYINDYDKLRELFGQLLAEVQRIKSEGDYAAAKTLVNNYAIKVDRHMHNLVLFRYSRLNLKPYKGFVNPVYTLIKDNDGKTKDVKISYNEGYVEQMLRYSKEFSSLPSYND